MALRGVRLFRGVAGSSRLLSLSALRRHERMHEVLPPLESFARRHIGPSSEDTQEMLRVCGVEVSLERIGSGEGGRMEERRKEGCAVVVLLM